MSDNNSSTYAVVLPNGELSIIPQDTAERYEASIRAGRTPFTNLPIVEVGKQ